MTKIQPTRWSIMSDEGMALGTVQMMGHNQYVARDNEGALLEFDASADAAVPYLLGRHPSLDAAVATIEALAERIDALTGAAR